MSSGQQKHSVAGVRGGSSSLQPIAESSRGARGISNIQARLYDISRALNKRREVLTKISHGKATEMAKKACVFNQDADENSEHQRSRPRWYLDGSDFEVGVRPICLDRLHSEE